MGFKELGEYREVKVLDEYINGGINLKEGYSVKSENFRLRRLGEEDTLGGISEGDLSPIELQLSRKGVTPEIPQEREVKIGAELEFTLIDEKGNPANLYGGDKVLKNRDNLIIQSNGNPWLLDKLGLGPEGLSFQGEIGTKPETDTRQFLSNLVVVLNQTSRAARQRELFLLPTGLSGFPLPQDWSNISPHPYIARVHKYGLNGTALDFDACSLQLHVDLKPFGASIEFGIVCANLYNNFVTTLTNALTLSAPFHKGFITPRLSNREFIRKKILTQGGVQDYIEVDGEKFLALGDKLVREGKIPVPERAGSYKDYLRGGNGSHKDTRVKLSTGTIEFCACDMHPDIELQAALGVILRRFVFKVAEHLKKGKTLPTFLANIPFETKLQNRYQVAKYGTEAVIKTASGNMSIREAWEVFLQWLRPKDHIENLERLDLAFAEAVVRRTLTPTPSLGRESLRCYFDPNSDYYLKGTFARHMLDYSESLPPELSDTEKIILTNLEVARRYAPYLDSFTPIL